MKKIILTLTVAAFAVAVQAGDAKNCPLKDKCKPADCPAKVEKADKAKSGDCPFAKPACCKKQVAAKQAALQSPKAAEAAN